MTCTPGELADLLAEDVVTTRAMLVLSAASAVVFAVARPDLPLDVAKAATLALAARVYRNPAELADWQQAHALVSAELAAAPGLERGLRRERTEGDAA